MLGSMLAAHLCSPVPLAAVAPAVPSCSQDGLAQQFLTSLAKLKASKDCVLGLAATLSLSYLAAEDANPCYLASVAAAVLVDQLLQVGTVAVDESVCMLSYFQGSRSGHACMHMGVVLLLLSEMWCGLHELPTLTQHPCCWLTPQLHPSSTPGVCMFVTCPEVHMPSCVVCRSKTTLLRMLRPRVLLGRSCGGCWV